MFMNAFCSVIWFLGEGSWNCMPMFHISQFNFSGLGGVKTWYSKSGTNLNNYQLPSGADVLPDILPLLHLLLASLQHLPQHTQVKLSSLHRIQPSRIIASNVWNICIMCIEGCLAIRHFYNLLCTTLMYVVYSLSSVFLVTLPTAPLYNAKLLLC